MRRRLCSFIAAILFSSSLAATEAPSTNPQTTLCNPQLSVQDLATQAQAASLEFLKKLPYPMASQLALCLLTPVPSLCPQVLWRLMNDLDGSGDSIRFQAETKNHALNSD